MASKAKKKKPVHYRRVEPLDAGGADVPTILLSWIASAYIMVLAFAILGFTGSIVMGAGNERAAGQAIFLAINAITLTGFRYSSSPEQATPFGQYFILFLTLFGWLVAATVSAMAGRRILQRPENDRSIFFVAVLALVAAMLFGSVAMSADRTTVEAMFLTAGAFTSSALTLSDPGSAIARSTLLVLLPLSVVGGAGLLVLLDLWGFAWHARPLSKHSRVMLALIAGAFLIGAAFLILIQYEHSGAIDRQKVAAIAAHSLNAREAGLPLQSLSEISRSVVWSMAALVAIGGTGAGLAGGIGLATVRTLCRGMFSLIRGIPASRAWSLAAVWAGTFVVTTALTFIALVLTAPQMQPDRLLFLSISATANIGLSHEPIALVGTPLMFLSLAMLIGRLLPIALLWCLVAWGETDDVIPL